MTSSSIVKTWLEAHRSSLVAFAERRLGSRASADDVVQQAAMRAFVRADQLRDPEAARAWLFQITRRLVADELRTKPLVASADNVALADEPSDDEEFGCGCVLANLARLPETHSSILRRSIIDGAGVAELADELHMSINAATVRLSRARAALREQLRAHCGTQSLRECIACQCNSRGCCTDKERA